MPRNITTPRNVTRGIIPAHNKSRRSREIPHIQVNSFKYGLFTYPEIQSVPRGGSPNSMNFLTKGDKIETRNGYQILGTENAGAGKITGLFTAHKWDGTEIMFGTYLQKLLYYNESLATPDWTEVGSNLLGSAASGEDVSMAEYFSPAGAQLWVSSPNSGLWKIMTANPGNAVSHYVASTNFKARISIKLNRMFAWFYLTASGTLATSSRSAIQLSYIDKQAYTTVTDEVWGTGDGVTKTFTGTASALSGKRTVFAIVSGTGNAETWTDNYLGVLTGSLGGTGTINYATGAYSMTYNTAPALGATKMSYQWEDATNTGIADFTRSATRTAGQGATFQQTDGGDILNVLSLGTIGTTSVQSLEYCVHERKTWYLAIGNDDTAAVNVIYRDRLTPGNWRCMISTTLGIFYVDITNKSRPYFGLLEMQRGDGLATPIDLSTNVLELSNYSFDAAAAIEWDKYILISARTILPLPAAAKNNTIFMYNKQLKTWDVVDLYASVFALYKGNLVAGDSATNNFYNLFTGWDDNGAVPFYQWDSNADDYGTLDLKKVRRMYFEGEIDVNQSVDVYVSTDRGLFTKIGTIKGSGSYVDRGQAVLIGSLIIGISQVGGGSSGSTAFHYFMTIKPKQDKFQRIQARFSPTKIGYFSCSAITHWDIVTKSPKLPIKYRGI